MGLQEEYLLQIAYIRLGTSYGIKLMISRTFQGFRDFMKRQKSNFRVLLARGAFANFRWGLTQNYTSIYTVELGADPIGLGSLTGVGSLVNTFLSAPAGWLADRYSLKKIFLLGLVLEALVPLGTLFHRTGRCSSFL